MVPLIEVSGIEKTFPGVKALSDVSFSVYPGEVHALCGENGAGKSTLIKILTGAYQKDKGIIKIDGVETEIKDTHMAIGLGISCVYQELSIVPLQSVAKNLYIGNLPMKGKVIDYKKLNADAEDILKNYIGLNISPSTPCGELSVGQQQMVEIGRALTRNARCIIMDEPTASLSEKETDTLFELIRMMTKKGIAIIYISHKLDEVMEISDRITVLRDGENIDTFITSEATQEELISKMIGRSLENMYGKKKAEHGETVLSVKNLTSGKTFRDISFEVKAGQIVGFFGLVGAGRSEIMRAIFGVDKYDSGEIIVCGKKLRGDSPISAIRSGICFCTEDRKLEGLALRLSVLTNMTIVKLPELCTAGIINRGAQREAAEEYVESISIKTPSLKQLAVNLSGGNQQKVVLAKWLMMSPKVLIIDEPTRGIDVGSKAEIYKLINDLAAKGVAIVVVSSEIEEVMGISDEIITIFEGKLTAKFDVNPELTREQVLTAALGGAIKV
jgi:ribose transport system ATP-binding protein